MTPSITTGSIQPEFILPLQILLWVLAVTLSTVMVGLLGFLGFELFKRVVWFRDGRQDRKMKMAMETDRIMTGRSGQVQQPIGSTGSITGIAQAWGGLSNQGNQYQLQDYDSVIRQMKKP